MEGPSRSGGPLVESPCRESKLVLTLVIHGTYGCRETWWRRGQGRDQTFADRLEEALAERGLRDTVWEPALRCGLHYDDFSWSGENSDAARRHAAQHFRRSLRKLAEAMGASRSSPLRLNIVAHSHGGNVVLELLKDLPESVCMGRVVLLGTPLLARSPSLRICRLILALLFSPIFCTLATAVLMLLLWPMGGWSAHGEGYGSTLVWMCLVLPFCGWIYALTARLLDFVWRMVASPLSRWQPVYGPGIKALRESLHERPIVLLTTPHDEACLLLQLGGTPRDLYLAYVRSQCGPVKALVELVLLRPVVGGMLLSALEVALECMVLGFRWSVLCFDYALAPLARGALYPPEVLERINVDGMLDVRIKMADCLAPPVLLADNEEDGPLAEYADGAVTPNRRAAMLLRNLRSAHQFLINQIKLRHSLYYESSEVLERVASVIAGGSTQQRETAMRALVA